MLTYHQTTAWHSAPSSWREFTTRREEIVNEGRSGGGVTTSSGRSVTVATESGLSTASTLDVSSTRLSNGGTFTGSGSLTTHSTAADTWSSVTNNATSFSGTLSEASILTRTAESALSLDFSHTGTSNSSTSSYSRAWPSSFPTTGSTTILGTTTSTTSFTLLSAVSSSGSRAWETTQTESVAYSSTDTVIQGSTSTVGTDTFTSTSTTRHLWLELPDTIIWPDADGGPLLNDALVWAPQGDTSGSTIGLFLDLFGTVGKGTVSCSLQHYLNIATGSTEWLSYALSTASATSTRSTTSQTGTTTSQTATTSTATTTAFSSLDGGAWHSTEVPSTTSHLIGTITGSESGTAGILPDTFTTSAWTFTSQETGSDASFQFTTAEATYSWGGEAVKVFTYNTWDRSFSTTSTADYPLETTTLATISIFSSNGQPLGTLATTLSTWEEVPTPYTYTSWDEKTNAALQGVFSNVSTAGGTTSSTGDTIAATWSRIDHLEIYQVPSVTAQSEHELYRYARFHQRVMPKGVLGMGDGFSASSPVYAGLTSSCVSGTADPLLSLAATGLPRFILHPEASVLHTGRDWLSNHPFASGLSLAWLSDTTGSRITGSLSQRWETTTTAGGGETTTTAFSATYAVGMTGPIAGTFISEVRPLVNTTQQGIRIPLEPITGSFGGYAAGVGAFSDGISATFPPGALSWSFTVEGGTSSESASTSTGELTMTCDRAIAWRFEDAMRLDWINATGAQLETASVYGMPPFPWTADPDQL